MSSKYLYLALTLCMLDTAWGLTTGQRLNALERQVTKLQETRGVGPQGDAGPAGPPGTDGFNGADGVGGVDGVNGIDGTDGIPGDPGPVGPPGPLGPAGPAGSDGADGIPGTPGKNGEDGADGPTGAEGPQGPPGARGLPGTDGIPGNDGVDGVSGSAGTPGEDGVDGTPGKPGTDAPGGGSMSSVYTRWGRTTCGSDSTLIYTGVAASSRYNKAGGGVNYLCLVPDAQNSSPESDYAGAVVAGVTYQTFGEKKDFSENSHNKFAPCARCQTKDRPSVMMVPGKKDCPTGWQKEYNGYLMSGLDDYMSQYTYECVDSEPEYVNGGDTRFTDGAMFFFQRPACGLRNPCLPYSKTRSLTCVMCSK